MALPPPGTRLLGEHIRFGCEAGPADAKCVIMPGEDRLYADDFNKVIRTEKPREGKSSA